MNYDFHKTKNYQISNEIQIINKMFFSSKKKETNQIEDTSSKDLQLITKMNQDLARSLDLSETDSFHFTSKSFAVILLSPKTTFKFKFLK